MARGQIIKFNKYQQIYVFTIAVATSRSIGHFTVACVGARHGRGKGATAREAHENRLPSPSQLFLGSSQPRSQDSLLGRVGENPGNEVGLAPGRSFA